MMCNRRSNYVQDRGFDKKASSAYQIKHMLRMCAFIKSIREIFVHHWTNSEMNRFSMRFIVIAFLCSLNAIQASTWYDQKLEGWYYFQEKESEEVKEKSPSLDEADEVLEIEKRQLKKLLSLALLVPTPENVENYLLEQNRWVNQSTQFADTWGKVLLQKPILGDFLLNPTTNYGVLAKREVDLNKRKKLLHELSNTCFLLFFFQGKDPFSEKAAEIANLFASLNHWKVKAISLDGRGVQNLKDFEIDKGISQNIGVEATPSFFVVDPFENKVFPVGAGLISVSDLEQNIEMQFVGETQDE